MATCKGCGAEIRWLRTPAAPAPRPRTRARKPALTRAKPPAGHHEGAEPGGCPGSGPAGREMTGNFTFEDLVCEKERRDDSRLAGVVPRAGGRRGSDPSGRHLHLGLQGVAFHRGPHRGQATQRRCQRPGADAARHHERLLATSRAGRERAMREEPTTSDQAEEFAGLVRRMLTNVFGADTNIRFWHYPTITFFYHLHVHGFVAREDGRVQMTVKIEELTPDEAETICRTRPAGHVKTTLEISPLTSDEAQIVCCAVKQIRDARTRRER